MDIVSAVLAFLKIVGTVLGLIQQEHERQTGIDLQKGADAETSLVKQREVDAIADHPVTDDEVDKALKNGEF